MHYYNNLDANHPVRLPTQTREEPNFVVYSREDTSTSGTFGQGRRGRRYKHGTGIFLTRAIRARGGGAMTAGITAVQLFRATPNPAAGPVRIRWQLPKQGQVSLKAYNIAGQCVAAMLDAQAEPGVYETLWTGCDNHGRRLGPGVYFYTLKTEDDKLTHKVVLTSRK
jgi:hypothetical protein